MLLHVSAAQRPAICIPATNSLRSRLRSTGPALTWPRPFAAAAFAAVIGRAKRSFAVGSMAKEDPHLWLEEVSGEKCLHWAKEKNDVTLKKFGHPEGTKMYTKILEILESKDKIAYVRKVGDFYYNFWQDADHVKGIWRRCTLEEYKKAPLEVNWELVLDLDALSKAEGQTWVWHTPKFIDLGPDEPKDICLLHLSPGGSDAEVIREFNVEKKEFVPEESGGFTIKECKSGVSFKSRDVLLVGTDTGADGDMTDSGYPSQVREWTRGQALKDAPITFHGPTTDVVSYSDRYFDRGVFHESRGRAITFYTSQYRWLHEGQWKIVDVPEDMNLSTFGDRFQFQLRSVWEVAGRSFAQGSLLSISIDSFFSGDLGKMDVLFAPTASESLEDSCGTRNYLVLSILEDVKTKLMFWEYKDGSWINRGEEGLGMESCSLAAVEADHSDELWVTVFGYTRPSSLFLMTVEDLCAGKLPSMQPLKTLPSFFKSDDIEVQQYFATSLDGTKVPYFQLSKEGIACDGSNPTLLYGYGGFEISLTPLYSAARGVAWLEHGGVWIDANIRGGGEYWPRWHQAALKANRSLAAICAPVCHSRIFDPENHQFLEEAEEANVPSPF
ncbi:unnamed protein product [Cladocopium goreaui]|uniref:Prolyl endopeptidase n=1 Tax=Cladocopium goreaui TaxID=2562237 RepID=A0A9P1D612_9DINO|nr:unnamed protein product [Cladocopium goreaui]